jgi:CxC2 like cysteine cluster associated with KDZ transposases
MFLSSSHIRHLSLLPSTTSAMKKAKALAATMKAKHRADDDQPTSTGQFIHNGKPVFTKTTSVEVSAPLPLHSNASSSANESKPTPTNTNPRPPPLKDPKPSVLDQFLHHKDRISLTILDDYASPSINKECPCGVKGAMCTTRCHECFFYPPTCNSCFLHAHRMTPTHWAHVWQPEGGHFLKQDISTLSSTPVIQLGHNGHPCEAVYDDGTKHNFIIVDTNGVHSTRLRFCACHDAPSLVDQLLHARLFPATFDDPRTAFTFSVLKSFEAHHHESAESAYSFISALRHLTDALFYDDTTDPYDQFCDVFKMWRLIKTEQRLGHQHGINNLVPSRPSGSLTGRCPSCPELGVNTDGVVRGEQNLKSVVLTSLLSFAD